MQNLNQRATQLAFGIALLLGATIASAETQIFVTNNSEFDLEITDVAVTGAKLSNKAWSRGEVAVPRGERVSVLKFIRTGKFNWMDPTPRFVEPGKTVVFSSSVSAAGVDGGSLVNLRQKLLGTGKSSKMWHGIAADTETLSDQQWQNDEQEFNGVWTVASETKIPWHFHTFTDDKDTHVEYIFGSEAE